MKGLVEYIVEHNKEAEETKQEEVKVEETNTDVQNNDEE